MHVSSVRFRLIGAVVGVVFIGLFLLVLFWWGLTPEARAVVGTRCTEDSTEERAARAWQAQFWRALLSERAGRRDLRVVLMFDFCGAPQKSLCLTLAESMVAEPRLRARLLQLDARSTAALAEICSGELDDRQMRRLVGEELKP